MKKIKRYLIKYHNGEIVVHWDGPFQPGDVSLCGSDLMGDGKYGEGKHGWKQGIETRKKVDCVHCLRIIEHVRGII